MDKKDTKTMGNLNLPVLKKMGSGSVVKKEDSKSIKPIDIESLKKKGKIDTILKKDSIKTQMKQEAQKRKGLDLVLIGDFTDSMEAYRETLRKKFKELCQTLLKIIPNLRIGIVFYLDHGAYPQNYAPDRNPYVTKTHKISVDIESLCAFIDSTPIGSGIDYDEAVEDALHEALNLNWSEINARSIVLFGDARGHEPNECDKGYDYFLLAKKLYEQDTPINTVYCDTYIPYESLSSLYPVDIGDFGKRVSKLSNPEFFSWLANVTGGIAIGVERIDDLTDIIKSMAAKDAGKLEELEEEVAKIGLKPIPALQIIKQKAKEIEHKKEVLGITYKK